MGGQAKILLLEDDIFLREGLGDLLTKEGYAVVCTQNLAQACKALSGADFDLLILDVMVPDGNALVLCETLRAGGCETPILFLTACDDEIQIVRGLDAGADDYVTKPFKLLELLSRIRALLRRRPSASVYTSGDISLDRNTMTVKKGGETVFLTPTEFQILSTLMRSNGAIVTRDTFLQNVWDCNGSYIDNNTLSVHISRLRDKIGSAHIATVRGFGYRWEE